MAHLSSQNRRHCTDYRRGRTLQAARIEKTHKTKKEKLRNERNATLWKLTAGKKERSGSSLDYKVYRKIFFTKTSTASRNDKSRNVNKTVKKYSAFLPFNTFYTSFVKKVEKETQ